ncbi:MAG TPA: RecQ family ATP-dependent DNA helicase [Rectinemataceae bacterium]|nr:RecQ family ATP-dependent DNA helicase [Rectinemataceae bacterium]
MAPEIDDPVQRLARERFGLDYLFPYQRLAVASVLDAAAEDAESRPLRQVVLLPTGFGKSLCFQLPALLLPGPTLVVYPLLALMDDQKRRLDSLGIACAVFRGGQSREDRKKAEDDTASGRAKIVITNPESLAQERLLSFVAGLRPSHVAIDEAHCVSEWGETFRPAYLELGRILNRLSPPAVSAFTATASPTVLESISSRLFGEAAPELISGDADRPNISYGVVRTLCREHSLARLARELARPLIVFSASREGVQLLARSLSRRLGDAEVKFYHAGLEKDEKRSIEEWFMASADGILVSTCAYGMGVDKRNIRSVIHFEAPSSVEAYMQESGRAGRDGLAATAILLSAPDDRLRLGGETGSGRAARAEAFLGYARSSSGCRRAALLGLLGAPGAETRTCSGCDRCEARASELYEGEKEIRFFLSVQSRRFDAQGAAAVLAGGRGRGAASIRCAGWGSMADWEEADLLGALAMAKSAGLLRECKRLWKGKLAAPAGRPRLKPS